MARAWRVNPPPNWPALPGDWMPAQHWRPDPAWGPLPTGWTLWVRAPRWERRRRMAVASVGSASLLALTATLGVAAAYGEAHGVDPGDRGTPRAPAAEALAP